MSSTPQLKLRRDSRRRPRGRRCTAITPTSSTRSRERARRLPLVMWHGIGQFSKTWETTPDGREGYQTIFLRRGFGVYLVDQPRRGRAGRSTVDGTITATPDDQKWFGMFRLARGPTSSPACSSRGTPPPSSSSSARRCPDAGPFDPKVLATAPAVSALFDKIGPGVLVTHSQGGGIGWRAAMGNPRTPCDRLVRARQRLRVPGRRAAAPDVRVPGPAGGSRRAPDGVHGADPHPDRRLLRRQHPVRAPPRHPGQDNCASGLAMARLWAEAVNSRKGGDVTLVHLPEVGFRGNTHFPFSDLNNAEIADLMSDWLRKKGFGQIGGVPRGPSRHRHEEPLERVRARRAGSAPADGPPAPRKRARTRPVARPAGPSPRGDRAVWSRWRPSCPCPPRNPASRPCPETPASPLEGALRVHTQADDLAAVDVEPAAPDQEVVDHGVEEAVVLDVVHMPVDVVVAATASGTRVTCG